MASQMQLDYTPKPASVFVMPYPGDEEVRATPAREHVQHRCGLFGGHVYKCDSAGRGCSRPYRTPCGECERRVRLSYKPGRYCSR